MHFSMSQKTQFEADTALWLMRHEFGIQSEVGPAAWRGTAVEMGCNAIFDGNDPLETAERVFDSEAGDRSDEKIDAERAKLPKYLANLTPYIKESEWPTPKRQIKVEYTFSGMSIPTIGYIDYLWPEWHMDLKTRASMPPHGVGTAPHIAQVAFYGLCVGLGGSLLYVTPGKDKTPLLCPIDDDMAAAANKRTETTFQAMERVLEMGFEKAMKLFPPRDMTGFMWDDATRKKATEIWY